MLALTAILLFLCTLCYTPSKKFLSLQYPFQLKIAALTTAADIRAFQQEALFKDDAQDRIIILSNKDGYIIESNNRQNKRYVYFKDLGCEGVYFAKYAQNFLSFNQSGAPAANASGDYVLKHYQDTTLSYTLTLQPASGRLDVNEN